MSILGRLTRSLSVSHLRRAYSKLPTEAVIPMGKDMIVCWHPERQFPYEHSLPLPEEKKVEVNSLLCIGDEEVAAMFKKKRKQVVVDELAKLTFTTKHRWYPRARDKKAKKTLPDRPYL